MRQPVTGPLAVTTVDYHAAGEPFRIVTGGVPAVLGASVLDRRAYAAEHLDAYRVLLAHEPRGHAGMYGCHVVPPDGEGADLGVVFFHNEGYSTACGHGTIALATWALDAGAVRRDDGGTTPVVIDAPSGRVTALARHDGERVASVSFRNVPAFVDALGVTVTTPAGRRVPVDIAYGGAYYASLPAEAVGLEVEPAHVRRFIDLGRAIKAELARKGVARHPTDPRLSGVYGVVFFEERGTVGECLCQRSVDRAAVRQRNITVFADGQVDRSPCGSGSSARLALLHAAGRLRTGEPLIHESVVGTRFIARVVDEVQVAGRQAVVTEIEGSAYRTGEHRFVLDPRDELGEGFLLR
ncbi:MAG: proline racemase family protein [Streptosporangiaceae bacterium]